MGAFDDFIVPVNHYPTPAVAPVQYVDVNVLKVEVSASIPGLGAGTVTSVASGNGLSGGPVTVAGTLAIDTAVTVDKTTAQSLSNKTLAAPVIVGATASGATNFDLSGSSGAFTSPSGAFNVLSNSPKVTSSVADGATAVAEVVDTVSAWSNTAARLMSWRSNSTERAAVLASGGLVMAKLFGRQAAVPTYAVGTGAGTGPTVFPIIGTDSAMLVQLTPGVAPAAGGVIMTITFNNAFLISGAPVIPHFVIVPVNVNAANPALGWYIDQALSTATAIVVKASIALTAALPYLLEVIGIG